MFKLSRPSRVAMALCVSLVALSATSLSLAQAGKAPAEPLSISDAQTRALMDNFSQSRKINTQKTGEQIYQAICQGCHMSQGQGAKGAGFYPPLANNAKLTAAAYPVTVVMTGLHGMPSFADQLSDEQVAEVVNYVRTNFGNQYADGVKPADVQALRSALAPQK